MPVKAKIKKEFDFEDVLRNRHYVDLAEFGEFYADHVFVDPEDPRFLKAVGDLYTLTLHSEETIYIPNAVLKIDLKPFWLPPDCDKGYGVGPNFGYEYPPPDVVKEMSAAELLNAPWDNWTTESIPEDWEYYW